MIFFFKFHKERCFVGKIQENLIINEKKTNQYIWTGVLFIDSVLLLHKDINKMEVICINEVNSIKIELAYKYKP